MRRILLIILCGVIIYVSWSIYHLDKFYFLCPIEFRSEIVIRSDGHGDGFFAAKRSGNRIHNGIDLLAAVGTPVEACRSAKVVSAKQNNGMGKYIVLEHRGGLISIYGHLSEIYVSAGQFVRQGQTIGAVGKTGNANFRNMQAHLHFEVRKDGMPVNPMEYLE